MPGCENSRMRRRWAIVARGWQRCLITVQRCAKKAITRRRRRWRSPDGPLPLLVFAEGIPSSVEAKPHCGLRQICSSGTYCAASARRALPLRILQLTVFGGDQPEDHLLMAGTNKAQRREIPERSLSYSRKKASTLTLPNSTSATGS